ncbi:MAG: insulinase family protein [Gammaproteobacteria bacterium]|nr:insulinase family protein [Gammaproteobacteria bacterium]
MYAKYVLLAVLVFVANMAQAGPAIQHWQTQNGARVYFVPASELPMADVRVVFDAGSARDEAKNGLAALTAAMLAEGVKTATGELNADEIAERFAALGAQFGAGADRDSASVSLRSLTESALLQPALDLMAQVLRAPTFPAAAFERERNRMLVGLRQQEQSPGDIAGKNFYKALYAGHPYAGEPGGTEQSVSKLTREDMAAFHARYYVAHNAVVAIVGALSRAQAEALAEQVAGLLPPGERASALPAAAPPMTTQAPQTVSLPHPSSQTHILLGQIGMSRDDPDYFPLLVGNHILGGNGLVSRISNEVREKRGLSYSAYSYFAPMRVAGPYTLGLQTRNDKAEEALQVLRNTLSTFVAKGPSGKELKAAKQNITGGFALRLDSNGKLLDYLALIGFYNLPLDYLDTYTRQVEQVTLAQIKDAFQRRIRPEQMVTVIVGGGAAP